MPRRLVNARLKKLPSSFPKASKDILSSLLSRGMDGPYLKYHLTKRQNPIAHDATPIDMSLIMQALSTHDVVAKDKMIQTLQHYGKYTLDVARSVLTQNLTVLEYLEVIQNDWHSFSVRKK